MIWTIESRVCKMDISELDRVANDQFMSRALLLLEVIGI